LKLMDEVAQSRIPLIITKHGKPVARLVPVDADEVPVLFGHLAGTARVLGDLIAPLDVAWEADA
ncbi:MAG: type II toxin-antitoxin system Phd/YefM family antitoxin, partial [Candidatus Sericytochromatia bacterium]